MPAGKPAVHLPALNHVGLWIDDLRGAVAWLEANGVRMAPGGIRAALRVTTSASSIRGRTTRSRSPAPAC